MLYVNYIAIKLGGEKNERLVNRWAVGGECFGGKSKIQTDRIEDLVNLFSISNMISWISLCTDLFLQFRRNYHCSPHFRVHICNLYLNSGNLHVLITVSSFCKTQCSQLRHKLVCVSIQFLNGQELYYGPNRLDLGVLNKWSVWEDARPPTSPNPSYSSSCSPVYFLPLILACLSNPCLTPD